MSLKDKEKWDQKYNTKNTLLKKRPHSQKLEEYISKCIGSHALDIACGVGRNSIFLAKHGFFVDAIDIAQIAIDTLKQRVDEENLSSSINPICFDTDNFEIKKEFYNLVVMCNFLDRKLIKDAQQALKKDGILFVETYMSDEDNEKKGSDSKNMLKPNELKEILDSNFEILLYDEFENEEYELYKMKKTDYNCKKRIKMFKTVIFSISIMLFVSGCTQTKETKPPKPSPQVQKEQPKPKTQTITINKDNYKPRRQFVEDNIETTTLEL
jgi:SAM-dependent methyltransferase